MGVTRTRMAVQNHSVAVAAVAVVRYRNHTYLLVDTHLFVETEILAVFLVPMFVDTVAVLLFLTQTLLLAT